MANESTYDAIAKKDIANILALVKAGRPLTAANRKALENHRRKEEGLRPRKTQDELAEEFAVDRQTIIRRRKRGCPFDSSDAAVYEWLVSNDASGSVAWKKAYREANPDAVKKKAKKKAAKKVDAVSKSAEELRDEYLAELQVAKEAGDDSREKTALNAYLRIDKQIRESEAHAKKLGIDRGEMLSRGEVERILKNVIWAGNACASKFSKQIAQRLSEKKPAEVYDILKPTLTALLIFEGMNRLAKTPGDINLPQWAVDCVQDERKSYLKP